MKYLVFFLAFIVGIGLWTTKAIAQATVDPEEPIGAPTDQDMDNVSSASQPSNFNPKRPPTVGPTLIVSNPQFFSLTSPFGLLGRSETAIAVSSNGKYVVEGWNDADGFIDPSQTLSGFAFSSDGGKTFTDGGSVPFGTFGGQPVVALGDPWLDVNAAGNGTFFYASLALRSNLSTEVGITVHRGTIANNILTWSTPAIIPAPGTNDFLDKESVAADKKDSTAVYASTTNFLGVGGSQIEVYRSTDAGVNWTGPTVVKTPDANGQQGSQVTVGPNGEVYVAWERGRFASTQDILFKASTDKGVTFGALGTVATITGTSLFPAVGYNRSRWNDFPRIAVDINSSHRGRIYVVYHDAGSNANVHTDGVFFNPTTLATIPTGGVRDGDVYLKFSDDMGATWSSPTLVSSAAPGDGKNQFWPVVSVEPGGNVDVIYYQDTEVLSSPVNPLATNISIDARFAGFTRRRSSYRSLVDVFWAQSHDGGASFQKPVQVNATASNWSIAATNIRPNFGDYITSVSASNLIFASWAQSNLYDIDPTAGVNNRFVPSAAFAQIQGAGKAFSKNEPLVRSESPIEFFLSQNFPNPFNPTTLIRFDLPEAGNVSLKVYDPLGQEVATLVEGYRDAGSHVAAFDARRLASGVYFYKLVATDFTGIRKMVLAK